MAILSKDEAKQLLDKVMRYSKADGCQAQLSGTNKGNIRYARNTVSTSGTAKTTSLVIQSYFGKKQGTSTTNEFDDASIEKTVRKSEELAQLAPENPEFIEPLGPQQYGDSRTYVDATAKITPDFRAQAADDSIKVAAKKGVVAAGYLEDNHDFVALANSKGLFAYNQSTDVDFTVTMRTEDGTGSGWTTQKLNDVSRLDTAEFSGIAADKAVQSQRAVGIEPGKYTVILEPAASIELIRPMINGLNARLAEEGRSFMSKKGGGTKLGEKIVDERINFFADPLYADAPASPFSMDGFPQKKFDLIRDGVVKNILYDRYWAQQKGVSPLPMPGSVVMEGGTHSLEEMIQSTKRGILCTRFWYTNVIDPQTLLCTGLTRDGTFYIENGKIKHPIKNLRFNESALIILNNLELLGKQVRLGNRGFSGGNFNVPALSIMIPYMKVRDFTFASTSDAI